MCVCVCACVYVYYSHTHAHTQVGDSGEIVVVDANGKEVAVVNVYDTQVYAGFVMHKGAVTSGTISTGASVKTQV